MEQTPQKKETIQEMKARLKSLKKSLPKISDPFESAEWAFTLKRKLTGLVFDDEMVLHECPWDENYPECPLRILQILERFHDLQLLERCSTIPSGFLQKEMAETAHSQRLYEELKRICLLSEKDMEDEAARFDAIYFHNNTFKAASIAAGSVINVINSVCKGETQNAFALVRPPGHHAMFNKFCGYCYFNNVAIGAKHALQQNLANKILIVDFDVHHGQATQQLFYNSDKVLYFSFHRYEEGLFWPNLRESNFDYIGEGDGKGYNINVPLNKIGLEDKDYFAVIFNILMPVAYEFNPDLVIFSAGYDACIGCPEGEMKLSPGFYGQFLTLLAGLAHGRQVVCLEGGYFVESLAEGAAMSLKSLLDDPPAMVEPFGKPNDCIIEVINNLRFVLQKYWKSLYTPKKLTETAEDAHKVTVKYLGIPFSAPYATRNCYPVQDDETKKKFRDIVTNYQNAYAASIGKGVCYVFDEEMYNHKTPQNFPERSERLKKLYEKFLALKLNERCTQVPSRKATKEELLLSHDETYINSLFDNTYKPTSGDIHFSEGSMASILTASGSLLNLVDAIMKNKYQSGVALIRPPGHHAKFDDAMGFCFVGNVALAAKYMQKKYGTKRILILDFDVHHGNGTQDAFYDSNEVLYISIHQYNQGLFFPGGDAGNYDKVGVGNGVGFNINIPFNKEGPTDSMGDMEYISVFHRIILPVAYSFGPEVVLVSAGFDAGLDDPIGHFRVTPEAFGHFVQWLKPLARGKIILALEGGYNVNTVAYSMAMCTKVLLGDTLPMVKLGKTHEGVLKTIEDVISTHKVYWPILSVTKPLPDEIEYST